MPSINTLIPDIYNLVGGPDGITSLPPNLGSNVADAVSKSLGPQPKRHLRLSQMGPRCPCALWYSIRHPELEEKLPAHARIKYCYGHIIEHLVIGLAKAAGHEVTGEQDELSLDGIRGHRDCVIDGCIVDVKSTASRSFLKFSQKTLASSDTFGYLDQLDGYALASLEDPLVRVKDRAYILAVDKQLGHLALYEHRVRLTIRDRISKYKEIVALPEAPACTCQSEADGKSGNMKLDVKGSYNTFKHLCADRRDQPLRTFLYSDGPRYLTKVMRTPRDVPEVDRTGKLVYNV